MKQLTLVAFFLALSFKGFSNDVTEYKKVDLVADFNPQDLFIVQEDLKKAKVDLTVNVTIPQITNVFLGPKQAEKVVIFNLLIQKEALLKIPKEKLIYFLWEPWEVESDYYEPFGKVYTWNDDLVDNKKFFKIHYPSLMPMITQLVPFKDKKLCVLVAGADINPKERKNDLYSERVQMVDFFETKPKGELEVFGRNWKTRKYRDYIGEIPGFHSGPEKIEVLKKYKFSICFENTKNINGYVTEKIFCCFAAGCVPVYWGAKNIEAYIPKGCYIDYRDFKSREELYSFLKKMTQEEYDKYVLNIQNFLTSEKAKVFSPLHLQNVFRKAVDSSI